ncbi:magnesium transporter CorA family protein [Azospirillum oryzae]|uniref:Magnesium transport protein CorA n=1 Tax=Azospirillum oryzae TaxID=286727 RepID=A0A6N1ARQ8_9PROT|nr:magnesium transporter CorA family protein [Azospirillum oryzae]KAA0584630.1 magnesium transporter CorA family protein [Azospirillum oryzae]QKS50782.1 magnesium transporter CorA family protein [Azospirillum oryzae]GLR82831.1 magnesium transport protein CorA [Azospirillum oryzae]
MITVHARAEDGRVVRQPLELGEELPGGAVWIDLLRPTEAERAHVGALTGCDLPTREEMKEIEASSQLYVEGEGLYMTSPIISRATSPHPEQGELTFVLTPRHLITLRYTEPLPVITFAARCVRQPELLATGESALFGLLDAVIDRVADVLELVGGRIDELSARVFDDSLDGGGFGKAAKKPDELQDVLRGIGRAGDLTHKVRDSLAGLDRLVVFMTSVSGGRLNKEQKTALKTMTRDLRSLTEHAGFLAHEANFLLDATLGLINIEQNAIIKIFSVVSVALMPPTLIASAYGMNFKHMPELDWDFGYPMAILLMVLSAVVPLWYFRRRGWL